MDCSGTRRNDRTRNEEAGRRQARRRAANDIHDRRTRTRYHDRLSLLGYCSHKSDSGHSLELVDLNDEYPPHLEITCTATSRREPKAEQFGGWYRSHSEVLPCKPPSTGKINAPYECQGSRCLTSTKCGVKDSPESKLEGVGTFVYAG